MKKRIVAIAITLVLWVVALNAIGEHNAWDCPECGRTGNTGNYCGSCAHPAPWVLNDSIPIAKGGLLIPISQEAGRRIIQIDGYYCHTVGLYSDGSVVAVGENTDGECDVSEWKDIVSIAAGKMHTVGLKKDGTVVVTGRLNDIVGEEKNDATRKATIESWTDIVAVAATEWGAAGLKSDGTVVAVGYDTSAWKDIIKIDASETHLVGLKSDGTVVSTDNGFWVNNTLDIQTSAILGWTDIVDVAAGWCTTIGLKKDGSVVAVGYNENGACNVEDIKNVISISASYHTTCLKKDGTVVAVGCNDWGECNVSSWKNIIAISNTLYGTIGLTKEGDLVIAGNYNFHGQLNFTNWLD